MRQLILFILLLWFPVQDLALAALYAGAEAPEVEYLRFVRDAVCVAGAAMCLTFVRLPSFLRSSALLYLVFILLYIPVGAAAGVPIGTAISTAGVVYLPFILTLFGYWCISSEETLRTAAMLVVGMATASAAFALWEVNNTWFWTSIVDYPGYLRGIKDIVKGFNPVDGLPWNFYGFGNVRRAAGLIAAPLAQGPFLVVGSLLAFALVRGRSNLAGTALAAFLCFGIYLSLTRGAILMAIIAFAFYVTTRRSSEKEVLVNIVVIAVAAVLVFSPLAVIWEYTVNLRDGSTIGHVIALRRNLEELDKVLLFGAGIGRQGAIASQEGLATVGGGEGSIFTIIYQLGLAGGLIFLWFYFRLWGLAFSVRNRAGSFGLIATAVHGLFAANLITFVQSEHILSFSGSAAFWILAGGTARLAHLNRMSGRPHVQSATLHAPGVGRSAPPIAPARRG